MELSLRLLSYRFLQATMCILGVFLGSKDIKQEEDKPTARKINTTLVILGIITVIIKVKLGPANPGVKKKAKQACIMMALYRGTGFRTLPTPASPSRYIQSPNWCVFTI